MRLNDIISESIHNYVHRNRLNENWFGENSFFEKQSDEDDSEASKKNNMKTNAKKARKRKKDKKMASESLMKTLMDYYQENKDTINLRGTVSEIYNIPTDTTGSQKALIKLNSKTRKVLAALNGEVREDNGIPYKLSKYVALRLAKMWEI